MFYRCRTMQKSLENDVNLNIKINLNSTYSTFTNRIIQPLISVLCSILILLSGSCYIYLYLVFFIKVCFWLIKKILSHRPDFCPGYFSSLFHWISFDRIKFCKNLAKCKTVLLPVLTSNLIYSENTIIMIHTFSF